MIWLCNLKNGKWYLFHEDEDESIAEVGRDKEDTIPGLKTYYWIDCEDQSGYYGYDTIDDAKSAAEAYFKGYLV